MTQHTPTVAHGLHIPDRRRPLVRPRVSIPTVVGTEATKLQIPSGKNKRLGPDWHLRAMTGRLRIAVAEEHTCDWKCGRNRHKGYGRGGHAAYDPAPIRVPAAPDYSTPTQVTARCRERGTGTGADILAASRRVWKAFRALVSPARCPVEDRHRPRWEYRWVEPNGDARDAGHYERRRPTSRDPWSICESDEQAS